MTHAERMELERAAPEAALLWSDHADSRFIRLLTPGGCPLLHMDGDLATLHGSRGASVSVPALRLFSEGCDDGTLRGRRTAGVSESERPDRAVAGCP